MIYVRAALELIRSDIPVHGLAHITGGGLLNLLRLNERVGFTIDDPLPVPPIIDLVKERGDVSEAEAWEVFNMGCGFVAVVPSRPGRRGDARCSRPTTPARAGSAPSPTRPAGSPSPRAGSAATPPGLSARA